MFQEKQFYKHTKFRVQIDENDKVTYWILICKKPYEVRLLAVIKENVVDFLETHSHAIPNQKYVLLQRSSIGVYVKYCKSILEMTKNAFLRNFGK